MLHSQDTFSLFSMNTFRKNLRLKVVTSYVAGLGFSGFGWARAFVYRASGGLGFFVSGFGPISGFLKGRNTPKITNKNGTFHTFFHVLVFWIKIDPENAHLS